MTNYLIDLDQAMIIDVEASTLGGRHSGAHVADESGSAPQAGWLPTPAACLAAT
jgi:hypothetical protein